MSTNPNLNPEVLVWEAVRKLDFPTLKGLLQKFPAVDLNWSSSRWDDEPSSNDEALAAIHVVCTSKRGESLGCLKLLAEHPGADVNRRTPCGWTPLNLACARGHPNLVHFLLSEFSALVSYSPTADTNWSPYWNAVRGDHVLILMLLSQHAAGRPERALDLEAVGRDYYDILPWRTILGIAGPKCTKWLLRHKQRQLSHKQVASYVKRHLK